MERFCNPVRQIVSTYLQSLQTHLTRPLHRGSPFNGRTHNTSGHRWILSLSVGRKGVSSNHDISFICMFRKLDPFTLPRFSIICIANDVTDIQRYCCSDRIMVSNAHANQGGDIQVAGRTAGRLEPACSVQVREHGGRDIAWEPLPISSRRKTWALITEELALLASHSAIF